MASKQSTSAFGDERLKKDAGNAARGSRDGMDSARVQQDGGLLSAEERRRLLRQESVQEILPTPPNIEGFHCCWLSTTNSTDPVYKRMQRGYTPVKASEVPGFGGQFVAVGGEFDGCIACNEMLLFKIDKQTYVDLMNIYHYDMPKEQEASIREKIDSMREHLGSGEEATNVEMEGSFANLGRGVRPPTSFI